MVLILDTEIWISDRLAMMSLVVMGMNCGDIGCRLIAGWLGCSGLLAMADEVLEILNSTHCSNCYACNTPGARNEGSFSTEVEAVPSSPVQDDVIRESTKTKVSSTMVDGG